MKFAGSLVIALMVLSAIGAPLMAMAAEDSAVSTSNTGKDVSASTLAARMYINKVSLIINKTLSLAEEYNITIPENLSSRVDAAQNLIAQAKEYLENDVIGKAIVYATRASNQIMPVSLYVWKHVPREDRLEIKQERLIHAIEARMIALHNVEIALQKLEEAGINVDRLKNITMDVNETLTRALDYAKQGNLTIAKTLMVQADKQVKLVMKAAFKLANAKLHAVCATASALRGLMQVLSRMTEHLNETITLIEDGRINQALARLNGTQHALAGLENALLKIKDALVRRGANETYIEPITLLINATNTSTTYINESINALTQNDTNTSIMYVTMAVDELNSAIQNVSETGLPHVIKAKLKTLREVAQKAQKALVRHRARVYSAMSLHIDKEKVKLELLLKKYRDGEITKRTLIVEAAKTYREMVRMKHSLEHRAPDWLIEKINAFLDWIKTNIPDAVKGGNGPGGPGGHHGGGRG